MVTIIASLQVKDGKMEEVKKLLKEIVAKIKETEPGCLEYIPHIVKGRKEKNTIIFYEKYADDAAMTLHMANLNKTMEKLNPLLEPGMDMKTCTEII